MYKFLSGILAILLVVGGIFYAVELNKSSKMRRDLSNEIAKLEGTIHEMEGVHSRRAIELEDLESENKDLQNTIEDRDEDILALTKANLRLKNKIIKIEEAKEETVPGESGDRTKVSFDKVNDPVRVYGFTLTNPAYAEINLEWVRDLKLNLVLTRDDSKTYRVYLDSTGSDVEKAELKLLVDPSILDIKWYERIGVGMDLNMGSEDVMTTIRTFLQVYNKWMIGPNVSVSIEGKRFYGINIGWFPFRN
jgi:hypothetical protein